VLREDENEKNSQFFEKKYWFQGACFAQRSRKCRMTTRNPRHKGTQKRAFWQHHINCWARINHTQLEYCARNNLDPSAFSRWKGKLNPQGRARAQSKKPLVEKRTDTCSFCGQSERAYFPDGYRKIRKLYYGENDGIAICDDCLWWKSHKLQRLDKRYGPVARKECLLCFQDKGGTLTVRQNYRIYDRCLGIEIYGILSQHPERLPCNNHCCRCRKKREETKQIMFLGEHHFLCSTCTLDLTGFFLSEYTNVGELKSCFFCRALLKENQPLWTESP